MRRRLFFNSFVALCLLSTCPRVAGQSAQKIIFGYIDDAPPVSSMGNYKALTGYCSELATYLNKNGFSIIEWKPQKYDQRFKAFQDLDFKDLNRKGLSITANKQPAIECGPHSKTQKRIYELSELAKAYQIRIDFSNIFYVTSLKLLINKDKVQELYDDPRDLRIGAPESTTNNEAIRNIYPNSTIISTDRSSAIPMLKSGTIDAYAGDEVILLQMLNDRNYNLSSSFSVEPKLYGFTREEYGVVVYNGENGLLDRVNQWILNKDDTAVKEYLQNRNSLSLFLDQLTGNRDFFLIVSFALAAFVLLLITHQQFILLMFNLLPSKTANRMITRLLHIQKMTDKRNPFRFIANYIVDNYLLIFLAQKSRRVDNFSFLSKQETSTQIKKLRIISLFEEYRKAGLTDDEAKERVFSSFASILRKWFSVSFEQGIEMINGEINEAIRGRRPD